MLTDEEPGGRSRSLARLGVAMILVSGVLWFSLFAIPFFALTLGQKAALMGGAFVGVQIFWWGGAALVGPQTVNLIRGWFSRKPKP